MSACTWPAAAVLAERMLALLPSSFGLPGEEGVLIRRISSFRSKCRSSARCSPHLGHRDVDDRPAVHELRDGESPFVASAVGGDAHDVLAEGERQMARLLRLGRGL